MKPARATFLGMVVRVEDTGGLGPVEVEIAAGGGPVTPASRVMVRAVGRCRGLLSGVGIDWGTGTGLLSIAAARIPAVTSIVAIERDPEAVANARRNVDRNGVANRVVVVQADLFTAYDPDDRDLLERLIGRVDFLIANPPASDDGDGLEWRRRVLDGARPLLEPGAVILLQVSSHYGDERIRGLADAGGYRFVETVERSPRTPFDLSRDDLRRALDVYVAEERRGGRPYRFYLADGSVVDARQVAAGAGPPLTSWQAHRFERTD
ncbi:50S ribosomal protein L3 glutamine methyltransferase [bacterium BMS3Bbin01]|nr:50S ribosomal protein L3 glutamine methyltransferase [bacterium BMS3Bbin01]